MSFYRFGDQWLETRLAFAALAPCPGASPVAPVRITLAEPSINGGEPTEWLHHWRDPDDSIHLSLARVPSGYWLRFPGLCEFLIDLANARIEVIPAPGLDADTLEHLLVDQVLPRYLAGKGDFVLHAASMRIDDKAMLILGESGWGKSTLAGLMGRNGFDLLSDDCMILRLQPDHLVAIPTYPSLRLFDDSIEAMCATDAVTTPVASYTDKRRLPTPESIGEQSAVGTPVAAIYLLVNPRAGSGEHHIQPLAPAAACMSLIQHAFQLDLKDPTQMATRLAQAATATGLAPAFALDYPRDYASADQLAGMLLAHLRSVAR